MQVHDFFMVSCGFGGIQSSHVDYNGCWSVVGCVDTFILVCIGCFFIPEIYTSEISVRWLQTKCVLRHYVNLALFTDAPQHSNRHSLKGFPTLRIKTSDFIAIWKWKENTTDWEEILVEQIYTRKVGFKRVEKCSPPFNVVHPAISQFCRKQAVLLQKKKKASCPPPCLPGTVCTLKWNMVYLKYID